MEEEIKKLKAELAEAKAESKKALELKEKELKTIGDQLAAAVSEIKALKSDNEAKDNDLADLNKALSEKEEEVVSLGQNPVLVHGKKKLELVVKKSSCMFEGKLQEVTADTLKNVPGLLDHVVKKGYKLFK